MVKSADSRKCDDIAGTRRFDATRNRCIAPKCGVRPILVVIGYVLADQAE